jgi:hypothetical protein
MIAIELQDLQVGKTYYIHQVINVDTHQPVSLKYKAVCTTDYATYGGWYDFTFGNVKGINTEDIPDGLGISLDEDASGMYKYYLCQKDEIIERVIDRVMVNTALRDIVGDPYFTFYT